MNRYRSYGRMDDAPEIFGDVQFTRLDMLSDPDTMPPGSVQVSENLRFDVQGARVRGGVALKFPAGTSIGTILLAGLYQPDGGNARFALVTGRSLVIFNPDDQSQVTYYFPGNESVAVGDPVDVIQAGIDSGTLPKLWILRGFDKDALKFDGATVTRDSVFKRGTFALYYQDRIGVNSDLQAISVSDFLDYTTWSLLNQFQIERGGGDYLVGMMAYQKDYVLIGSRKKWFIAFFDPKTAAGGYAGGLNADTSFLRQLTAEAGPVGKRAFTVANGMIWFVSDKGIFAFTPQLDNELTVLGKPISADIQPIMDRLSANFAGGACVEHYGYRLYFALPISEEPLAIIGLDVESFDQVGLELPFDLPALLATGSIVTIETEEPHNLVEGDRVQIANAVSSSLNRTISVFGIVDATHFSFAADINGGTTLGDKATVQKLATRNNLMAVFNLNLMAWESIDLLPEGFFADWLRVADFGSQRRLYVVDAEAGPALYEEGDVDEIESIEGGVTLPFDVPVDLSEANFTSQPIVGRLKTRACRWTAYQAGSGALAAAYPRHVRAGQVRVGCSPGDSGTVTLTARAPNRAPWVKSRDFPITAQVDNAVKIRCGKRALSAEMEIITTNGRPTIRAVELEITDAGRSEES